MEYCGPTKAATRYCLQDLLQSDGEDFPCHHNGIPCVWVSLSHHRAGIFPHRGFSIWFIISKTQFKHTPLMQQRFLSYVSFGFIVCLEAESLVFLRGLSLLHYHIGRRNWIIMESILEMSYAVWLVCVRLMFYSSPFVSWFRAIVAELEAVWNRFCRCLTPCVYHLLIRS